MEALLFCSALWNMTPLLKNIRKWGKLQEAVRPVCGCPCVNTSAYFHLSSSSTNMFTLLLKLLTYFMKLDIFTLDSSTQMHVLPALCCEICNHNCDIFRGSEAHCTVLQLSHQAGHWSTEEEQPGGGGKEWVSGNLVRHCPPQHYSESASLKDIIYCFLMVDVEESREQNEKW